MNNCTAGLRHKAWALLLLLGAVVAMSTPLRAELAHAYGEDFRQVGKTWPDGHPPVAPVSPSPRAMEGDIAYRDQLQAQELAGGPYADGLAEPLLGLGRRARAQGDLAQALGLYARALHVVRVNDGLYSERQGPLVREMLDMYRQAGDMESLDDLYGYFFHLYGAGKPPWSEVKIRAALEYLRWQREAYRLGIGRDVRRRLLDSHALNEDLLEHAEGDAGVAYSWYRDLALSQVRNLYLVQLDAGDAAANYGASPSSVFSSVPPKDMDFNQQRLDTLHRTGVARGRTLLEGLAARAVTAGPLEQARVQLELGDWYQWNNESRRARDRYARVEQLLADAGENAQLRQWLGRPVELPDNGAFWQMRPPDPEQPRVLVRATFDVSRSGRARNIRAGVAGDRDEALAWRLRRKLTATRFRPAFSGGEPREVQALLREYELFE